MVTPPMARCDRRVKETRRRKADSTKGVQQKKKRLTVVSRERRGMCNTLHVDDTQGTYAGESSFHTGPWLERQGAC
jgi:hypothetical protein